MKAFILFLKEVESTHTLAQQALTSAKSNGLDAEELYQFIKKQ